MTVCWDYVPDAHFAGSGMRIWDLEVEIFLMDDRALIAETNRNFYRAMRTRDMRLMEQVWLHADWVGCVHPGWSLLVGWPNIRHSWLQIFSGAELMQIMPSQVVIHIEKELAWVTCVENITTPDAGTWQYSVTQATNLFQRVSAEWRMIHHHASPMPPQGAQGVQGNVSLN